ncbi:putative Phage_integrase [Klebsormidium nitens]|uniref:Putative Phage_integrase n=1 Tax=Klebsormidium nitens TaxID=105231 RepID=A0A1Y1IBK2_KLENI|nr:putative Phage_integrase [Klebsormidium nitens]|eukprot:GAQ85468.1 putative Phage_integrase [Klebsormidium nitens]
MSGGAELWRVGSKGRSALQKVPAVMEVALGGSGPEAATDRLDFQRSCEEQLRIVRGVGLGGSCTAGDRMSSEQTRRFYEGALASFGKIAEKSVNEASNNSRKRTFQQFQGFLAQNAFGITVETATPADVGAFIVGDWIPSHSAGCRTKLPQTGECIPSVSAVTHVVKDLAKSYALLGYEGRSNPAKSEVVKSFRVGYEKMLHEQGVKVKRAKVFTEEKLDALLAHLARLIQASGPGLERCVLLTDQAAVLYLWESRAREKDCGQLQRQQVKLGEQAAYPGWSKTVRQEPSARIPLAVPVPEGRLAFVEAAVQLLHGMEEGGFPVGEDGFLFRAMNRSRTGFVNEPMSSDTLRKRIQKRLKDAGLFEGETVHSFRRSAVQHAAVNLNYNVKELMDLGRWKSYAAFRLYVEEVWRK